VTNHAAIAVLSDQWSRAGVKSGDMLFLHSNIAETLLKLKRLGFELDLQIVLDSFLDTVGSDGTLLLPLFNFGFCSGHPFDLRGTPSRMGILTEAARKRSETIRTGHPVYSFAVLGKQKEKFRDIDNYSGYGSDSPFGLLHRAGGKIGVLDVPDRLGGTFYHYVEESMSVDYRYHKQFSGLYTDAAGKTCERTYEIFVRKLELGVVTRVDPMGELLWAKGLYSGDRPGTGSSSH
jgi:aminoglycoside 3-N-acetyltransferase